MTLHPRRFVSVDCVDRHSLAVSEHDTGLKRIAVTVTRMNHGRQESLTYSTLSSTYD